MNRFLADLEQTLDQRFADDTTQMSMGEWIQRNTKLRKKPFSFKGFEFQEQIINDMHPDLTCTKPSQVGLTESQLRKYLGWLRRTTGASGIYTMPDDKMRDRVSQTRVKPLIDNELVFNPPSLDKPIRQKGLYQIGDSFAYFTGSTEGDATSIPADILIHDELDLTDQQMVGLFQSRLQMSIYKIRQQFSTPTYHGYGIDRAYTQSDQYEYFVKCGACNQHQLPEFHPKFITLPPHFRCEDLTKVTADDVAALNMDDLHWRCERCSALLDLGDPSRREWVPRHPGRISRGYRVRPTSVNSITIPYIFTQVLRFTQLDNLKGFHNTVLGEAYNDSNARISEADIRACMKGAGEVTVSSDTPCFIGIDVGLICHLVVGAQGRAFLFQQVPQAELKETVEGLFRKFNIVSGVMDRYPFTPLSEAIRDLPEHNHVIWPVAYATTPNAPPLKEMKDEFTEITHYVANRTRALDAVHGEIRNRRLCIEGFGPHQGLIIEHLRDMVRIETADTPPIWNKMTGDDHFFHALGYMLLSQRLLQAILFNTEADQRNNWFLLGGQSLITPDLSPRSLNRTKAGHLGLT